MPLGNRIGLKQNVVAEGCGLRCYRPNIEQGLEKSIERLPKKMAGYELHIMNSACCQVRDVYFMVFYETTMKTISKNIQRRETTHHETTKKGPDSHEHGPCREDGCCGDQPFSAFSPVTSCVWCKCTGVDFLRKRRLSISTLKEKAMAK